MKLDTNSLAHTQWECKYHIVFAPKYRRQIIYGKIKQDIGQMIRKLCEYKGVEIIEAEACKDHIHMLVSLPPKYSVSQFMGYLKGKSTAAKLTEYYIANGISGIFALSSTGEYFAMGHKQRADLVDATVKAAAGRVPVLAAASDASLEIVKENIRQMAAHGADGVVLTAPYYFKYSQSELYQFFSEAADSSPVPVLLYNQPTRLPSALGEEPVLKLADHPNIIGLKDTSADASRLGRMAAQLGNRDDFLYYAGSESLAAYGAFHGINYVYALASVEPELFVNMKKMADAGDIAGVLNAQARVDHLCKLFRVMGGGSAESFTNFAAAIKGALEVKGFGRAYTAQIGRLPTDQEYEAIRSILEQKV